MSLVFRVHKHKYLVQRPLWKHSWLQEQIWDTFLFWDVTQRGLLISYRLLDNQSVPPSRLKVLLELGWIGYPETSVTNCQCALSNVPGDRISDLHRDGRLKWRTVGFINHLTPNGHYMGRTPQLTSRCCILYIYSTNIRTEYFKHAA